MVGGAGRLVLGEGAADVLWKLVSQAAGLRHPGRGRRRRRVEDEAYKSRGTSQRVLDREHRAPGGPEEVDPVEAERLPDRPKLVHEELDRPEVRIVGPVGVATPELVVDDEPPALLDEPLERLEVVVRGARAAVETDQGNPALRPEVAVPGVEPVERDTSLDDPHRRSGSRIAG
jgi:hypothetical protein